MKSFVWRIFSFNSYCLYSIIDLANPLGKQWDIINGSETFRYGRSVFGYLVITLGPNIGSGIDFISILFNKWIILGSIPIT